MTRPPGRPPLDKDAPSVPLTLTLSSKQLAVCEASARRERVTIQEWIRRVLWRAAPENKK